MITRDQLVEIGRFNKTHGVNGELSAAIDCDFDELKHFTCLISPINGIYVPFFLVNVRPKNSEACLLKIEGIANETEAELLVNKDIFVKKQEYEEACVEYGDDALPLDYFIGFTVKDNSKEIGTIIAVNEDTENCLFVVESAIESSSNEILIPACEDFICDIDVDNRVLNMELPLGLVDL